MKTLIAVIIMLAGTVVAQEPAQPPADVVAAARAERLRKCAEIRAQIAALEVEKTRKLKPTEKRQAILNECNTKIYVLQQELWKVSTTK